MTPIMMGFLMRWRDLKVSVDLLVRDYLDLKGLVVVA